MYDASQPCLKWTLYYGKERMFFLEKSSARETIQNHDNLESYAVWDLE